MRLNDKVIVVTGAARGIGEGVVRAFHAEGAIVVATDILAQEIQELADWHRVHAVNLDGTFLGL